MSNQIVHKQKGQTEKRTKREVLCATIARNKNYFFYLIPIWMEIDGVDSYSCIFFFATELIWNRF